MTDYDDVPRAQSGEYSDVYEQSRHDIEVEAERLWWCPNCGAIFDRHHAESREKFCYNCQQRDAVLVGLRPVGKGSENVFGGGGDG